MKRKLEWMSEEALSKLDPVDIDTIEISNNLINNIGMEYWGSPGIEYYFGTNINISHNYIVNVANSGIEINGHTVGCDQGCPDSRIIEISKNKIENTSLRGQYPKPFDFNSPILLGGDAGGIYTNNNEPGLTITENYIKNVVNHYTCIYLDGAVGGVNINRNVCDQAPSWIYFYSDQPEEKIAEYQVRDMTADDNYTNVTAYFNGINPFLINEVNPYYFPKFNISVTDTHYLPNSNWPADALKIINEAGLEPNYQILLTEINP